jgi:hypothetical protein
VPTVTYFAKIGRDHPRERPLGIVRRIHTEPVPTDEAFCRDLQWHPTEYLHRHWLGHNTVGHVEITEEEAEAVIARWREQLRGS